MIQIKNLQNQFILAEENREKKTPGNQSQADKKKSALDKKKKRPNPYTGNAFLFWLVIVTLFGLWYFSSEEDFIGATPEIEYSQFRQQLVQDNIEKVHVQGDKIEGSLKEERQLRIAADDSLRYDSFTTYIPSFGDDRLFDLLDEREVTVSAEPESISYWWYFFVFGFPFLLLLIIGFIFYRRMQARGQGIFNIGKSQAKLQNPDDQKTRFDDVAGQEGAKTELREVIEFLKNPERFQKMGAKIPKGMLLVGPPGTGKTLLARASAGEANVPFFTITGSDFMEMFVGVGAKRVREMFKNAKENSPCIIFIDELDSIGRKRGAGLGGGHDEREQTLNQLLSELDGFEPSQSVVIMGATNRPDILDPALLRPGRFDRQITVDLPSQNARAQILELHSKNKPMADDIDFDVVARSTPGFSGADLENLLNEATLYAGREKKDKVTMDHIDQARDKVMMGLKREGMQISDEERNMLAYHEAGHALVAAVLPHSDPIHKVTIVPRGKAMGVTQQLPKKEKYLYDREYLLDRLAVIMGGRAAEHLIFNTATSGAQNDLMQVSKLSRKMVLDWGMSEKFGHISFGGSDKEVFLGRDMSQQREYSDSTAREIDEEVRSISKVAFDRALKTLEDNRDVLDKVAQMLLDNEEIPGKAVEDLLKEKEESGSKSESDSDSKSESKD